MQYDFQRSTLLVVEDCFDLLCVIAYNIQSIGRTLKLWHISPSPLAFVIMLCNSLKFE